MLRVFIYLKQISMLGRSSSIHVEDTEIKWVICVLQALFSCLIFPQCSLSDNLEQWFSPLTAYNNYLWHFLDLRFSGKII